MRYPFLLMQAGAAILLTGFLWLTVHLLHRLTDPLRFHAR